MRIQGELRFWWLSLFHPWIVEKERDTHTKKKTSPREKSGSTYLTMASRNCLADVHLITGRNCDLEGKYLLRQNKAVLSVLDMSDLAEIHSGL